MAHSTHLFLYICRQERSLNNKYHHHDHSSTKLVYTKEEIGRWNTHQGQRANEGEKFDTYAARKQRVKEERMLKRSTSIVDDGNHETCVSRT